MKCPKCKSGNIDTKYRIDDSHPFDEREYLTCFCRDCNNHWTTTDPDDVQKHFNRAS